MCDWQQADKASNSQAHKIKKTTKQYSSSSFIGFYSPVLALYLLLFFGSLIYFDNKCSNK
jgi:hypothetical protein